MEIVKPVMRCQGCNKELGYALYVRLAYIGWDGTEAEIMYFCTTQCMLEHL